MSLRARLLAGIAFVAAILTVVSAIITFTTRQQLIAQVDARLETFTPLQRGGAIRARDLGADRRGLAERLTGRPVSDDGRVSDAFVGVVGTDGQLMTQFAPNTGEGTFSPPRLDLGTLSLSTSAMTTVDSEDGQSTFRMLTQPIAGLIVVTALPIDEVQATIARLVWIEVLGSATILLALALVGWWVLHLGIRPVQEMTAAAALIAAGDLAVRLPETSPGTESAALAASLNVMLGRIEQALADRSETEARLRRFVADASHELRTPITTIRGYAELYRHGGLADVAALDDAMRRTEDESARMGRLVADMLTLAKLDVERPLERRRIDLVRMTRDTVTDAALSDPTRRITLDVDRSTAIVDGDEDRLRQAVINVLGNALVHTNAPALVAVRIRHHGEQIELEVSDQGPGMDPEIVARVTERFFRADPARSRHRGGSGLGLSIVAATVAAHGGTLAIDSTPGVGTTVHLMLPGAPDPSPPPQSP